MAVRNLGEVKYVPFLSVRPAEMVALQELPQKDKDLLFPCFSLRPWTTAHRLQSVLSRIEEAYGQLPAIVDLSLDEPFDGNRRPVHDELDALRNSDDGYRNWVNFIQQHPNMMPCIQISDPAQLRLQIRNLLALDRGICLRLPEQAFSQSRPLINIISEYANPSQVLVIFDFERQTERFLTRQLEGISLTRLAHEIMPGSFVSISASSFPDSFTSVTSQEIYERTFFNSLAAEIGGNLIFGDRGSARAERQSGGGGLPAARIDYAVPSEWTFFRDNDQVVDRLTAYQDVAKLAVNSPNWDPELRIWGSQMIERTALEDVSAIISPMRATAVRINIHLHQQLFYGAPLDVYRDTDDDWSD